MQPWNDGKSYEPEPGTPFSWVSYKPKLFPSYSGVVAVLISIILAGVGLLVCS
jgi:hypothetical protein